MEIKSLTIGGWFQRTNLHLSEIHDFLLDGSSRLELNSQKLEKLHLSLNVEDLHLHVGAFDYIRFYSDGIEVKIFEDGLIVLQVNNISSKALLPQLQKKLTNFFEHKLSPALNYLFSLGAQMPKELAHIETIYPYFIYVTKADNELIGELFKLFGEKGHSNYDRDKIEIYRGDKLYIVNTHLKKIEDKVEDFIEQEIFVREFKAQLHHYLNLHRIVWEKIAHVKERGKIKGSDVAPFKQKIESYAKTINLIDTRLDQMDNYLDMREEVAGRHLGETELFKLMHYKYSSLKNSLSYMQDIWTMTNNYVKSALDLFSDLQAKATESSIKSLTIITTIGVFASLSKVLSKDGYDFTFYGVLLLISFIMIGLLSSKLLKYIGSRRLYTIKNTGTTNIFSD